MLNVQNSNILFQMQPSIPLVTFKTVLSSNTLVTGNILSENLLAKVFILGKFDIIINLKYYRLMKIEPLY
jgi:hypothetical protein